MIGRNLMELTGIITEFTNHIINFVEQPNPALNNMPVCPFAKRVRTKNLILFHVMPLTLDAIVTWVKLNFNTHHELMIIINDNKTGVTASEVEAMACSLNETLVPMGLQAFWGHPEATFNVNGVFTRREPYPNIQVVKKSVVAKAEKVLAATDYYSVWSDQNKQDVQLLDH